ncbi:FtsX-like permease family protein [Candidatus Woesearchaeota archaeon]|nr:FtsX-like permease family protein [Candidatus Woesearchaeota archaeon]
MIKDILKYSLSNLWNRKLRSFLTMLSILIGITAIFALISFGQGLNSWIDGFAQEMGTDKVFIMPGGGLSNAPGTSNIKFNEEDLDFIRKIKGVDEATAMMAISGKVGYKDYRDVYPFIIGLSTESNEMRLIEEMFGGIGIMEGRGLKKGDVLKATAGYSYTVPNRLFKRELSIGSKVAINDVEVEIVGFYEEVGSPTDDAQLYLSQEGFEEIFDIEEFEYIYMRVAPGEDPSMIADRIKEKFRKYKGQKEGEEDFTVQTFEDILETFTSILLVLNGVLVIIALISVVVAAVNIMNTMYTSILERTKEIGVMKSIGARNEFILLVFVTESGVLGFLGGLIGVILGAGFAKIGGMAASAFGLTMIQPDFPCWLIAGCLIFAFLVGSLSGLIPAIQASKLNPVDALRYE